MKVIILDDYQNAVRSLTCFVTLADHEVFIYTDIVKDTPTLAERLRDAEAMVLIRERTPVTEELLDSLPKLRLISQTGGGIAHIDLDACTRHGVAVAAGGGSPFSTAELTWGLILAALRHIPYEVQHLREGHWQSTLGTGLHGRTLGVYGYGKIGSHVARVGQAFGMRVLVWGREGSLQRARQNGFDTAQSKAELFQLSDVLTLHLRLNPETRGIVNAADLAAMKPTALIVNTSRAALIEEGALAEALKKGRPGLAVVDVFEEEPILNGEHPLLKMQNAVCTPHLGYVEQDMYELYFQRAFDRVEAYATGKPIDVLNPEVLA